MRNLRVYMDTLKEKGHLKAVKDTVDWSLEAAAITATSYRQVGPALHFQNVKGYPDGYTLAGGLFSGPGNLYLESFKYWSRVSIAMGLDADISYEKFLETCLDRTSHPILPISVDSGPVKQVVRKGTEVDVTSLPIPLLHAGDGGRYSTLQTLIVRDYESDWVVWENIRVMIVDEKRLVGYWPDNSKINEIYAAYKAKKKPMPFCISMGGPPLMTVSSFLPLGRGESPAAIAGGLNLDPIELMKAETNDLFIPAQAEVIIEGEVSVSEDHKEGPFPEYWFYKDAEKRPVFNISAITHRNDPIIPISVDGVKPSDKHILQSLMISFEMYRRYTKEKNMFVKWVQLPIEFNFGFLVVSAPILFPGYVSWLSKYAMANSRPMGSFWNKVIIVDDKTSSASLEETIVCLIQRSHANNAYHMWDGLPVGPNARWASAEQKKVGASSGLYVDTSWPLDWTADDIPRRCNLEGSYPEEMIKKVVENYKKYGFKGKPVYYPEGVVPF